MIKKYPAPHIRKDMNISMIYPHVLIALLPCAAASVYYYGLRALVLLITGMAAYALSDYLYIRFVSRQAYVWEASGLVSGAILAMLLPPSVPVWILLAGVLFASIIVKQLFGGLGSNLFNPALAARAFLSIAFPSFDAAYSPPLVSRLSLQTLLTGPADAVSSATPLMTQSERFFELLSGRYPGAIGTTCAIAVLIGGAYLVRQGILRLQAPLMYIFILCLGYWVIGEADPNFYGMFYLIFTGGVLFAAVFAMGDYSTTPTTHAGRLIFGAGAAVLTLLIRDLGNASYAVGFSVLAMNAATPILDLYIRPRVYGMPGWFSDRKKTAGEASGTGGKSI